MPTISEFYGIKISINFIGSEHNPPHVHIYYGSTKGSVDIKNQKMIVGNLSKQTLTIVKPWIKKHERELLTIWNTQEFVKLPPLE